MIYAISPKDFGLTTRSALLRAAATLGALLAPVIFSALRAPGFDSRPGEILALLATWVALNIYWYASNTYELEVDDQLVRVGRRTVRRGHVRYLRESDSPAWRGGARLLLSERSWPHLYGGIIAIPKSLPDYEQLKRQLLAWMQDH